MSRRGKTKGSAKPKTSKKKETQEKKFVVPPELKYKYLFEKWVAKGEHLIPIANIGFGGYRVVTYQGFVFLFWFFFFFLFFRVFLFPSFFRFHCFLTVFFYLFSIHKLLQSIEDVGGVMDNHPIVIKNNPKKGKKNKYICVDGNHRLTVYGPKYL